MMKKMILTNINRLKEHTEGAVANAPAPVLFPIIVIIFRRRYAEMLFELGGEVLIVGIA